MKKQISEAERIANSGNWQAAMETAYYSKNSAMDWAGFEATLRAYAKACGDTNLDGIIIAFSGRGSAIPFMTEKEAARECVKLWRRQKDAMQ